MAGVPGGEGGSCGTGSGERWLRRRGMVKTARKHTSNKTTNPALQSVHSHSPPQHTIPCCLQLEQRGADEEGEGAGDGGEDPGLEQVRDEGAAL